uniref:Putative ribonuclease H-like domain-containing protein n=1 Tax=Tanacetum cinerariifolium TaxID=118510 RepID=A0A6L2KDK0_TANCI|nr:putative ribonuclease H-like domain-containing protein [Tanacetum cinerariifolium]
MSLILYCYYDFIDGVDNSNYAVRQVDIAAEVTEEITLSVDGVVQIISPSTAEQRLVKKNKLKAKETLLMALPDKHQLEFNIHRDAKTLMEAIEKRNKSDLEEQSLDDLFDNLKIYKAEVKGSSTSRQNTQNIDFVSLNNSDSTNESVNAVPSVSAISSKATVSTLPNLVAMIGAFRLKKNLLIMHLWHMPHLAHQVLQDLINRDNALVELRKKFEKAKKEKDDLKLTLEKFWTSSKNLSKLLKSQVIDKTGLCYDSQVFNSQVFDCEELHSHEFDNSVPKSLKNDRLVPTTVLQSTIKSPRPVKHVVNKAHSPIRRPINHIPITKNSNFYKKVTTVKVNKVNVVQGSKGNAKKASANWLQKPKYFEETNGGYVAFGGNPKGGKITGKCKIKTGNLDFDDVYFVKELKFNLFSISQMCDKKNKVLFVDIECVVLSSDYKMPHENHVLRRVPRENNIYNVDLKSVVPSRDLTCLFAKATLDEVLVTKHHNKTPYELLLGRTPSIGKVRKETVSAQKYVLLPLWSTGSQDPQNTNADIDDGAFDVKENENNVHVSPSGSGKADNKKHDEKAKRDDKGKNPVDSPIGVRDLRAEFEAFSSNSTNRVNVVSTPVTVAGPNLNNNTNSFNIASPFDTAVSPPFGIARKFSIVDPSKYPDDPNMTELEDIVYSDDKEDVGAEANLSNLETNIPVNPILTTRVYKDHPVNQIISDLNLAP